MRFLHRAVFFVALKTCENHFLFVNSWFEQRCIEIDYKLIKIISL